MQAGQAAFERWHPLVPVLGFAGTIGLAMFGIHPVCAGISLLGGLTLNCLLSGLKEALVKLRWQLPLLALICIINPLYASLGSTLLMRVGPFRIYAESVAYGAVMGALLVSVLLWFEAAGAVVGSDELLELSGGVLPSVALALSMTMRLIPLLMRRTKEASEALAATRGARGGVREAARLLGALLTWALEDSVERADSMRARGWGGSARRSTYHERRFRRSDACALAVLVVLTIAAAGGVSYTLGNWHFYPRMEGSAPLWCLVPYALLAALPSLVVGRDAFVSAREDLARPLSARDVVGSWNSFRR